MECWREYLPVWREKKTSEVQQQSLLYNKSCRTYWRPWFYARWLWCVPPIWLIYSTNEVSVDAVYPSYPSSQVTCTDPCQSMGTTTKLASMPCTYPCQFWEPLRSWRRCRVLVLPVVQQSLAPNVVSPVLATILQWTRHPSLEGFETGNFDGDHIYV